MNILDLLQEDKIKYEKVSANKEEYTSSCPKCGGEDRFCISLNKGNGGLWWCRQCKKGGGIVQYLKEFRGMSDQDACHYLGLTPTRQGRISKLERLKHPSSSVWQPAAYPSPDAQWQKEADSFIKWTENNLWSDTYADIRSWLFNDRGLNEKTIKSANLGWIPKSFFCPRERWGLSPDIDENGKSKDLWMPAGLVIPYIHNQQIQRIRIRLQNPIGDLRYYILPGSTASVPMLIKPKEYMVIVESELDALLINQEAGDIVGVIALGSVGIKPDIEVTEILKQAELVLVSLDSDEAGAKESLLWWEKQFPNARRWCPINGKDPTEAYQNGLNLRSWILAGISNFIKPQEEGTITLSTPNPSSPVAYNLIEDKESLNDAISQIETSPVIAIDIEATGLDPLTDKIRLIQLAVSDHPVMIIDTWKFSNEDLQPLKTLLSGPSEKIFQNAKFDMKFLYQAGFKITGQLFDTMLATQLLTSGIKAKGFRLDDLARDYLNEKLPKEYQKSDWTGEISQEQLKYAARDALILLKLKDVLTQRLDEAGLSQVAQLEFDCLPAVVRMELNGMFFDGEKIEPFAQECKTRLDYLKVLLNIGLGEINLNSPEELIKALKNMGIPVENTNRHTLTPLANKHPVIKMVMRYRKLAKYFEFIEELTRHTHSMSGRIHAEYRQIGTATGRFSCCNPCLQNIPREKALRDCFIPASGNKLIIADYSQIELRVAAEISQDSRMIMAYKQGRDLHKLTASLIMDKPLEEITGGERQSAKAVNFGLTFGMGPKGLKEKAQNEYGVTMTEQEATIFRDKFFNAYQGLNQWHQEERQSARRETRTLTGRRREWKDDPKITEILNTPVQGTAADIIKKALTMLPEALNETGAMIICCVHDEIILEAPENMAEQVAQILKNTMERAGQEILRSVPVIAETTIADSWSEK